MTAEHEQPMEARIAAYTKVTTNKAEWNGLSREEQERRMDLLRFKTGGMRGVEQEGFGGINRTTCTLLANVLARRSTSFVIGYDMRNGSEVFAQTIAAIFSTTKPCQKDSDNQLGVNQVRIFKHCTTPYLAMESSEGGIGVMITASHNAREYNGFKVYIEGAQIRAPVDKEIEAAMVQLIEQAVAGHTSQITPPTLRWSSVEWDSMLSPIDFTKYFNGFHLQRLSNSHIAPYFCGLFGLSGEFMAKASLHFGMSLDLSSSQNTADGNFPGMAHPNPEILCNYKLFWDSIPRSRPLNKLAYIFMCDPDGDRFGLAWVKNEQITVLNGDEIAKIFVFYLLKHFPLSSIRFVNTFLCGDFITAVSKKLGIPHIQTESGFKYVSKGVEEHLQTMADVSSDASGSSSASVFTNRTVVFAYEDPLGFLITPGREKDGVKAAVLMYTILQKYSLETIADQLAQFGIHNTHTVLIRVNNPKAVLQQVLQNIKAEITGERYTIDNGSFRTVLRISGTESMVKVYNITTELEKHELVELAETWIANNITDVIHTMA